MVALAPVAAHVVRGHVASAVVGPAYDALRPAERRALADANPDSFFNVVRSVADYPDGSAPSDLLERNREALRRLLAEGRYDPHPPSLFVYRIETPTHTQTALVGDLLVEEYRRGVIRAHERTRAAKESELARHLAALGMQSSPVGLGYRHDATIDALLTEVTAQASDLAFDTVDGTSQQVWTIDAAVGRQLVEAARAVEHVYIIDGHHRVAAAEAVDPDGRFLAALVADVELRLLPYHRVVAGPLPTLEVLLARLAARFAVTPLTGPITPSRADALVLAAHDRWFELRLASVDVERLPAVLCDDVALPLGFGIEEPRHDPRLSYHPGGRPATELGQRAAEVAGAAVLLHAPAISQVFDEADAGRVLPPKSTWFEPKLRSGVFVVER